MASAVKARNQNVAETKGARRHQRSRASYIGIRIYREDAGIAR